MEPGPFRARTEWSGAPGEEAVDEVPEVKCRPPRPAVATPPARRALADLCGLGVADGDLRMLLRRVAELAGEAIPGVDGVSVVVGDPAEPELLVTSSTVAQSGDGVQHLAGIGPTFAAYASDRATATGDLLGDLRDPTPARGGAGSAEARSCVALPVRLVGRTAGVVTLYARRPGALDAAETVEAAGPFVAATQALVRDTRLVADLTTERDQLREALSNRGPIEQAKGMIMLSRGCGPDEAFRVLVRMSNVANRKLRDVAAQYVAEGGTPPAAGERTGGRTGGRPGARRGKR